MSLDQSDKPNRVARTVQDLAAVTITGTAALLAGCGEKETESNKEQSASAVAEEARSPDANSTPSEKEQLQQRVDALAENLRREASKAGVWVDVRLPSGEYEEMNLAESFASAILESSPEEQEIVEASRLDGSYISAVAGEFEFVFYKVKTDEQNVFEYIFQARNSDPRPFYIENDSPFVIAAYEYLETRINYHRNIPIYDLEERYEELLKNLMEQRELERIFETEPYIEQVRENVRIAEFAYEGLTFNVLIRDIGKIDDISIHIFEGIVIQEDSEGSVDLRVDLSRAQAREVFEAIEMYLGKDQ